jgi:hypothetical protein
MASRKTVWVAEGKSVVTSAGRQKAGTQLNLSAGVAKSLADRGIVVTEDPAKKAAEVPAADADKTRGKGK